jgi:hypothetical protein
MAVGESVVTAPSGIPGDLPVVFSVTKYRDSVWWTNVLSPLFLWEGSALGIPTDINPERYGEEGSGDRNVRSPGSLRDSGKGALETGHLSL